MPSSWGAKKEPQLEDKKTCEGGRLGSSSELHLGLRHLRPHQPAGPGFPGGGDVQGAGTPRGVSCDGGGPGSGQGGCSSGRQLVRDEMLQRPQEGTRPNSNIFAQVEDLGVGECAL